MTLAARSYLGTCSLILFSAKATLTEIEKDIEVRTLASMYVTIVQSKPDDPVLWQRKATFLLGVLGRYDSTSFETAYNLSKESASFFCKGALVRPFLSFLPHLYLLPVICPPTKR